MKVNDRYCSFYYENDPDVGQVAIEAASTALLVVDMQHVFVTRPEEREEAEAARWEPYYRHIDGVVVPNNARILEAFRAKGMDVSFARIACLRNDGADRSLVQRDSGYNELLLPLEHPQSQIVPELAPRGDEIVFTKTTDSVVTGTRLPLIFRNMGIETVVVTGVMTDQCVSGTVRALADESFKVWLIEDACAAATEELQRAELTIINNIYCHVIDTEELLAALAVA